MLNQVLPWNSLLLQRMLVLCWLILFYKLNLKKGFLPPVAKFCISSPLFTSTIFSMTFENFCSFQSCLVVIVIVMRLSSCSKFWPKPKFVFLYPSSLWFPVSTFYCNWSYQQAMLTCLIIVSLQVLPLKFWAVWESS